MSAKQNRLVKKKDFEKIFKLGKACYTNLLGVKVLTSQFKFNRFGIIVSTKVSKKATTRNKLKRQIRRALESIDKKLFTSLDMVIIVLPASVSRDYKEMAQELEKICFKLKLIV
jgi:ribonuclease P protein component